VEEQAGERGDNFDNKIRQYMARTSFLSFTSSTHKAKASIKHAKAKQK
jgi:hypothetical protein